MRKGFKLLSVLLITILLAVSATAQINWLKQDGSVKYLAWDNGTSHKSIFNGGSATFTTGYFGSTAGQSVHLTATINSKADGKIVSTLVSKNINVVNSLGYQEITILPEHYKNKVGEYIIVIKLKDANSEAVDTSLYLNVKSTFITEIPPVPVFFNKAPVMDQVPDKNVFENHNVQFTVSATDPDNDEMEFEAQVCIFPIGSVCFSGWKAISANFDDNPATFDEETGLFKWKPSYNFVEHTSMQVLVGLSKKIDFRFKAVDEHNKASEWKRMTITVKDLNRDPEFNPIGNKVGKEKQLLTFTISATDADGDDLEYSILSASPFVIGASLDKDTGAFKWVPPQEGVFIVTFKVVDKLGNHYFGGKDIESITITVTEAADKPECDDGKDNDGDGKVDYPADPGCKDKNDDDESDDPAGDKPQCKDGKDNDGDGKVDYPADPGCKDKNDDDESDDPAGDKPQCDDGIDNDGDGKIDYPTDPGCKSKTDDLEKDSQCIDKIDNDGDGLIDYPQDPGCSSPDDNSETPVNKPQCSDGLDNDGDGKKDKDDPGCHSDGDATDGDDTYNPKDDDETDPKPQCNDGLDNDGDGKVDYPKDLGCSSENDNDEFNKDINKFSQFINIKFKSVFIEDEIVYAGDTMTVHVDIVNNGKVKLEDVEIQATIYEIGAFGSTSDFDLSKNQDKSRDVHVYIPDEAYPGWYLVKVTAKNYHYHTSIYRIVYIDSNTYQ